MRDFLAPFAVVTLLFVGFFKASPFLAWAPIDLTLVAIGAVCFGVLHYVVNNRAAVRIPIPALAMVAAFLPALLYAIGNPYADEKRLRLVIPLIAVVAACYLVRGYRRQQIWVWLHVLVGIALVATASGTQMTGGRLAGAGSNTIGAGRASGVAVVVLVVLVVTFGIRGVLRSVAALAVAAWLAHALIETGSRGPVFACAAAIFVVAACVPGQGRIVRLVASALAVVAGWAMVTGGAGGAGAARLQEAASGESSLIGSRSALWNGALSEIATNPVGVGWGNFWNVLSPGSRLDSGYNQNPHNVLLEVLVEGGWLAGLALLLFLFLGLRRLQRGAGHPYGAALLGIAVFFVINAMVSGDLNDNRMMFAAVAMAWVSAAPNPTNRAPMRADDAPNQVSPDFPSAEQTIALDAEHRR